MAADRTRLLTRIRHQFADKNLLNSALSHPSTAGEQSRNYERMEFLGVRVLGLIVAHWLFEKYG
ncbi:MAG: ribonuclease III, partial [Rhodospirillales bacterium]